MIRKIIAMLCMIIAPTVFANAYVLDDTLNFVKNHEGFIKSPRQDASVKGEIIIGYSTPVDYSRQHGWVGHTIDEETASRVLRNRLGDNHKELHNVIPNIDNFDENVIVAVSSAYYNNPKFVGKRFVSFLQRNQLEKASRELAWGHSPKKFYGLVTRRFAEANLIRAAIGEAPLQIPKTINEFYKNKKLQYPIG